MESNLEINSNFLSLATIFLVERTSGGLIILNHIEKENLAKADLKKDTVKDNI